MKKLSSLVLIFALFGCEEDPIEPDPVEWPSRYDRIPADAVKMTPGTDHFPPVIHSNDWQAPQPMAGPVNTAGAEDAPVISPDGQEFFFFFTPDVDILPEKQLLDSVTGIWYSRKEGETWTEPTRVLLSDDLALDGPLCFQGDTLWFASFRVGNYRDDGDIYIATREGESWANWQNAGEKVNSEYNVGELYTTGNGKTMIFHRAGFGGFGEYDLWQTTFVQTNWTEPINLGPVVNGPQNDSHPYLSPDGRELWFTGWSKKGYTGPALFRTILSDTGWTAPEEIFSNFAGDPGLDAQGNVYFTHHYFSLDMKMIEADIYIARKK